MKDKKKVNLSQTYELNTILLKYNKRETKENREILIEIAKETNIINNDGITDRENLYNELDKKKNSKKLEDKK